MSVSGKLFQSSSSLYTRKVLASVSSLPPVNGNEDVSHVPKMSHTAFGSNLVIILAALLCALVCALGCNRRVVSQTAEDVGNRGLNQKPIPPLPAIVYGTDSPFLEAGADCPICLAQFQEGENLRVLPKCNHSFHVDCIDTWLLAHSSCPTCRSCLVDIICDTKSRTTLNGDSPN